MRREMAPAGIHHITAFARDLLPEWHESHRVPIEANLIPIEVGTLEGDQYRTDYYVNNGIATSLSVLRP
jgi:hypothetical protein